MIDVQDGGGEAELVDRGQQKYGIGAAGDGDADSFLLAEGCGNLLNHILILRGGASAKARWRVPCRSRVSIWAVRFPNFRSPLHSVLWPSDNPTSVQIW